MANSPALVTPYVTLAKADVVNAGVPSWDAATTAVKNSSLSYGRQYIDSKYSCVIFDEDDAPSEIQMANSLLAIQHIDGVLWNEPVADVIERASKAGEVMTKTRFARSNGTSLIDPFPEISSILYGYCKLKSAGVSVVTAVRS